MALTLYYHPLSSFCMKALVALYENGLEFEKKLVNFMDADEDAAFRALWPVRKFPLLDHDGRRIAESTTIIEYLALQGWDRAGLIPADAEAAFEARRWDRLIDLEIHIHMQKIVGDRLRPADAKDPAGVAHARAAMQTAYGVLDAHMADREWAAGDGFTLADCAAAPALHYASLTEPFDAYPNVTAYLERLKARPSFARVLEEAAPYFDMMPKQ